MKLGLGLKTELVCIEEILRRAASGHSSTNGMRMLCIGCLAHCAEIITTYWYRTPRPLKVGGRHGGSVAWNTSVDSSQIVWRLDVSDCICVRCESLRLSTHSFEKDSMPYRYRNRARLQASQRCIELLQLEFPPPSATTRKSERERASIKIASEYGWLFGDEVIRVHTHLGDVRESRGVGGSRSGGSRCHGGAVR